MRDLKCTGCGLEDKFFANRNGVYHLNLYGVLGDNTEMIFTLVR